MSEDIRKLRTSERVTYKRCRQKWWWGHVNGLVSKSTKPALRFGSLVHDALAAFYIPGRKRGPLPARTFKRLYKEESESRGTFGIWEDEDEWVDAGELGVDVLTRYHERYGNDDDIDVIAPEHPFSFQMKDSSGRWVLYVGRFDALVRIISLQEVGLLEHKTAAVISDAHLSMDEQANSYFGLGPAYLRRQGILKPGEDLAFILYNFLRKARKDERPTNEQGQYLNLDGSVSKKQPPPYFERFPVYRDAADRASVLRRIRLEAWEMEEVRQGRLPVYKNPTRDCSWDCSFYQMCELHETGSDWKEYARQMFYVHDPYEDYRKDG